MDEVKLESKIAIQIRKDSSTSREVYDTIPWDQIYPRQKNYAEKFLI